MKRCASTNTPRSMLSNKKTQSKHGGSLTSSSKSSSGDLTSGRAFDNGCRCHMSSEGVYNDLVGQCVCASLFDRNSVEFNLNVPLAECCSCTYISLGNHTSCKHWWLVVDAQVVRLSVTAVHRACALSSSSSTRSCTLAASYRFCPPKTFEVSRRRRRRLRARCGRHTGRSISHRHCNNLVIYKLCIAVCL